MNQKSDHIQVHQSKFINLKNIINLRRIKKDLAVLKRPHSRTSMTIPRRWHHHKRRTWSLSFSNDLHFIVFITSLCCLLSCSLNFSCNMSKSNITLWRSSCKNINRHLSFLNDSLNSAWTWPSFNYSRCRSCSNSLISTRNLDSDSMPDAPTRLDCVRTQSRKLFLKIIIFCITYSPISGGSCFRDYFRRRSLETSFFALLTRS